MAPQITPGCPANCCLRELHLAVLQILTELVGEFPRQLGFAVVVEDEATVAFSIDQHNALLGQQPVPIAAALRLEDFSFYNKCVYLPFPCDSHLVSRLESKADIILGTDGGMVKQRRPKFLIKIPAESAQPLQTANELHTLMPHSNLLTISAIVKRWCKIRKRSCSRHRKKLKKRIKPQNQRKGLFPRISAVFHCINFVVAMFWELYNEISS